MICFVPHIISFKGFYFEGRFKPEVMFMQVDDGSTHMLDEVFDERVGIVG